MYPLLIASIFVVAIAVERYLYFKTEDPGKKFVDELVALLRKGQWDEAKTFAQNKKGTFGRILAAAMEKDNADAYSLEAFLETESGIFIAQLRERLNYLSVIVTMPKGDAFAPRNSYALAIDFEEKPPLFKVSDSHYAATWLLHPNAPKVTPPAEILRRYEIFKAFYKDTEEVEVYDECTTCSAG